MYVRSKNVPAVLFCFAFVTGDFLDIAIATVTATSSTPSTAAEAIIDNQNFKLIQFQSDGLAIG